MRVLFDEQASTSVARALACLGKACTFVGGENQVPKGTPDKEVAASARAQGRILLTFNFDMVLAAADEGVRFIWFDQRNKDLTLLETAFILLRQWDRWEEALRDPSVKCLKVGRQSMEVLSIEQARRRAQRRMQRSYSAKKRARKPLTQPRLQFDDDD
jgi:predicted nuclease of predicted toxin-antitoxin system